jgi:hypothetical protein
MKLRSSIAAVAAVTVIGSGAFVLPALASPHAATHTLRFISVTKTQVSFTKTSVGIQDTDVNSAGKVVGFDDIYGTRASTSATSSTADFVFVTRGGILYGTFTINLVNDNISNAKVTGGTGIFRNATGSFVGKDTSNNDTAITLTYSN